MPDIPTALPDGPRIRALIRERGYSIKGVARKIGCKPSSIYGITGRKVQLPRGVEFLGQLAHVLSTPARTVRVSDISDWAGDDDTGSEPEPKARVA
jgi:transcriptional regulator with XRE-family HTH domain